MTAELEATIRTVALTAATLGPVFTAGILYEKLRRLGQDVADHSATDAVRFDRVDASIARHGSILGYIRGHLGLHEE